MSLKGDYMDDGKDGMIVLRVNAIYGSKQYHDFKSKMADLADEANDASLTFETEDGECELLL